MKSLRFFAVGWIAGAVLAFFIPSSVSISIAAGSASTDEGATTTMPLHGGRVTTVITHRKLKVNSYTAGRHQKYKGFNEYDRGGLSQFRSSPKFKSNH